MPTEMEGFEHIVLNPVRNVLQIQLLGTGVRMNECQEKSTVSVKIRWQSNLCRLPE